MCIREIEAKSALHYHEQEYATKWDLNIYRGCKHMCAYCFARYSHKYLESEQFFDDIFVKVNVAEVLDKEMSAKKWKHDPVVVSGVCDCYQPIEAQYQLMPQVFSTFIKHRNPAVIITKSDMILRDIELINKLTEVADVNICISLMTLNEAIIRQLEPGAPTAQARLHAIEELKKTKAKITLIAAPTIPLLNDTEPLMEEMFRVAAYYKVDRLDNWVMHLRGCNKREFLQKAGDLINWQHFNELYRGSFVCHEYHEWFMQRVIEYRHKYNIRDRHITLQYRTPREPKQISLFDIP